MSFFQRLCSAPFLPVSCSLPGPHPDPQGCLYNLLERQPENSWPWEGNPLILPSTGHTEDLGDAQLQSGGPRRSSRLDLPRDLVLEMLSRLNLLRDPLVPGVPGGRHASICPGTQFLGGHHTSTCPGTQFSGGPSCLNLPGDSISWRLSRLSLPGICTVTW